MHRHLLLGQVSKAYIKPLNCSLDISWQQINKVQHVVIAELTSYGLRHGQMLVCHRLVHAGEENTNRNDYAYRDCVQSFEALPKEAWVYLSVSLYALPDGIVCSVFFSFLLIFTCFEVEEL